MDFNVNTNTDSYNLKEIQSISFGILSPEEVVRNSVCKVNSSKQSGPGSVYDEKMGVMDNGKLCVTCNQDCKDCPGHFGHIELNQYILNPMLYKPIVSFLKCFCNNCHRFLLSEDHLKLEGISKLTGVRKFDKILNKLQKIDKCFWCKSSKPKIIFVSSDSSIYQDNGKSRILVLEEDIRNIFENVSNDDVKVIGFDPNYSHPRNTIISMLPVIPPRDRPYVISEELVGDDDLTLQYQEIIKVNNKLEDEKLPETKRQKFFQTLKFRIKALMNNSAEKAKHSTGRPYKGIKERLTGKDGQVRNNLMGKRCDETGRTPIGPDPNIRCDEVIVPEKMAKILTVPEHVNNFNREMLEDIIDSGKANFVIRKINGKDKRINLNYAMYQRGSDLMYGDKVKRGGKIFDPAKFRTFELKEGDSIIRETVEITDLKYKKKRDFELKEGDIVERQLRDGDIVLINRQPSLHSGSLMAKRALIKPFKTIRINLPITKSFNADFDGRSCHQQVDAI